MNPEEVEPGIWIWDAPQGFDLENYRQMYSRSEWNRPGTAGESYRAKVREWVNPTPARVAVAERARELQFQAAPGSQAYSDLLAAEGLITRPEDVAMPGRRATEADLPAGVYGPLGRSIVKSLNRAREAARDTDTRTWSATLWRQKAGGQTTTRQKKIANAVAAKMGLPLPNPELGTSVKHRDERTPEERQVTFMEQLTPEYRERLPEELERLKRIEEERQVLIERQPYRPQGRVMGAKRDKTVPAGMPTPDPTRPAPRQQYRTAAFNFGCLLKPGQPQDWAERAHTADPMAVLRESGKPIVGRIHNPAANKGANWAYRETATGPWRLDLCTAPDEDVRGEVTFAAGTDNTDVTKTTPTTPMTPTGPGCGPVMTPRQPTMTSRRTCGRGYRLAVDGLCYPSKMLPASFRMNRPRKAHISYSEYRKIRQSMAVLRKIQRLEKRTQEFGKLLPKSRRRSTTRR